MKRTILKISLLCVVWPVWAQPNTSYMGFDFGYANVGFEHTIARRSPLGAPQKLHDYVNQGILGVHIGHTWFLASPWHLNAELVYLNHLKAQYVKIGTTTTTSNTFYDEFQALALPGYTWNNLSLDGLIGISYGRFSFRAFGVRNTHNEDYHEPGFVIGAGTRWHLTPKWSSGFKYEYVIFHSKDNLSGNAGFYLRHGYTQTNNFIFDITYAWG